MSWLDPLFQGISNFFANGTQAVKERGLNLIAGPNVSITAVDNPAASRTDVTIASTGGTGSVPTGTGFTHITAGAQDGAARSVGSASSDIASTTLWYDNAGTPTLAVQCSAINIITTSATPATAFIPPWSTGNAYEVTYLVVAKNTGGDLYKAKFSAAYKYAGSVTLATGDSENAQSVSSTGTMSSAVATMSGGVLTITGIAATTINWRVIAQITVR